MKTVVPDYYGEFKCIADKCKHSCCIGWEIDIDSESYDKYMSADGEMGERLRKNIIIESGTPHFVLGENERCPFLNNKNLCDLYTALGEESLCQICTDHPRFRNFFDDRIEMGIGLCCEEAGRLILGRKQKSKTESGNSDFLRFRQNIFDVLQNREKPIDKRIEEMLSVCDITLPQISYEKWARVYMSLERMDEEWTRRLDKLAQTEEKEISPEWEIAFEQLIVYFIFRHLSGGLDDGRIAERAAFAALGVHIINGMFGGESIEELIEIARLYSSEIEYCEDNIENLLSLLEQY